jgi:hypothetical protein
MPSYVPGQYNQQHPPQKPGEQSQREFHYYSPMQQTSQNMQNGS